MTLTAALLALVILKMNMSDLSTGSVASCYYLTSDDNTAAYTGSESNGYYVLIALATAAPHLTKRCNIGVVSGLNGNSKEVL